MRKLRRLRVGRVNYDSVYIISRNLHGLLLGGSGSGKSTTVTHCFDQDRGMCRILIEPHGFLAKDCYSIAKRQGAEVEYVSLEHSERGFNPMNCPYDANTKSEIVAEALNQMICSSTPNERLYAKMRDLLDIAVKACDMEGRRSLEAVLDRIINGPGKAETKDGLVSRLRFLLSSEPLKKILCSKRTIRIGELIDQQKTLIVDCSGMSTEKLVFMGHIVSQLLKAYFLYERPEEYKPCAVYIDECQLFTNLSFLQILREARKFNLSVMLATQSFAGMRDEVVRTLCNVGNILCYRVGYREASLIAKEMNIRPEEIQFMEKYHAAYLTPEGKGFAKMNRPLYVKPREVVKAVPKVKTKGWFTLGSCPTEAHP